MPKSSGQANHKLVMKMLSPIRQVAQQLGLGTNMEAALIDMGELRLASRFGVVGPCYWIGPGGLWMPNHALTIVEGGGGPPLPMIVDSPEKMSAH
ncbi:hypothetical protein [Reyranella soli]|nr:hypothetical protein [Reyranella soli]